MTPGCNVIRVHFVRLIDAFGIIVVCYRAKWTVGNVLCNSVLGLLGINQLLRPFIKYPDVQKRRIRLAAEDIFDNAFFAVTW